MSLLTSSDRTDWLAQALRAYSSILLTALLGLTAWGALQFVEVRDTVRELNVTVPLRFQAIETRVVNLERAQRLRRLSDEE